MRKRKKQPTVENEVRILESRLAGVEGVNRFMMRVQREQLQIAERLRKSAVTLLASATHGTFHGSRCVDARKLSALKELLAKLHPFHTRRHDAWLKKASKLK